MTSAAGAQPDWADEPDVAWPGSSSRDVPGLTARLVDVSSWWNPSPAPDGQRLAVIGDDNGVPEVWVVAGDGSAVHTLDAAAGHALAASWSPDGAWLACQTAPGGSPRTQVWVVRPDGTQARLLAGGPGCAATFGAWGVDVDGPGWLLGVGVTASATSPGGTWLIDPGSGRRREVVGDGAAVVLDVSADGWRALVRRGTRGCREVWETDLRTGSSRRVSLPGSLAHTESGFYSFDAATTYLLSDGGEEMTSLYVVRDGEPGGSTPAGRPVPRHGRPDADLCDVALSRDGSIALLWNVGGPSEVELRDPTGAQVAVPDLPGAVVRSVQLVGARADLLVDAEAPDLPRSTWVWRRPDPGFVPVPGAPARPAAAAVWPRRHRLTARDGLAIDGWLLRPWSVIGPAPTVVYLHGGPEAEERPGFMPLFQALAAAGVSVFAANVRGSSGRGRSYQRADDGAGRFAAIDDVAACVDYLVGAGLAEAGRVACMGRSYGGYLTLAALVAHPELFAAGIAVCGMSDFATFYTETEPWIAAAATSKYGDPQADRALLDELSPMRRIGRVRAPLLVVHGATDTNVPLGESQRLVAALARQGSPYEVMIFDDEGHEIAHRRNRVAYVQACVEWLTGWL